MIDIYFFRNLFSKREKWYLTAFYVLIGIVKLIGFGIIAVLMLGEVREVMKARDLTLRWDETVPAWLVKKGYSTVYGARNLRRLIQKEVEDRVAAQIVEARGTPLSEICLTADESGCEMSPALPAQSAAPAQAAPSTD